MKTLSKEAIFEALRLVASQLEADESTYQIVVAGGAALVLLYGARESTKDVDIVQAERAVKDAAQHVAIELGLPKDWLNDGVKGYVHGLSVGDAVFQSKSLVVRTLTPHQLLAMKLSAWRDDLDIDDARLLMSKLEGTQAEVWARVQQHVVPGRELKARYAFEDLWESRDGFERPG